MKSVDIFRPLARCRPQSTSCTTSIFRQSANHGSQHQQQPTKSASSESESFVISVPPGQWPPQALSSTSECTAAQPKQPQELDRCAPLPTGTTSSSGDRGSPLSASRKSLVGKSSSSSSPAKSSNSNAITPPSYYKIELVKGDSGNGTDDVVQLTAGDDSSVQLTPDHNEQLQLAANNIDCSARVQHSNIIRASPIVEYEGIEHDELAVVATDASTKSASPSSPAKAIPKKHTKEESSSTQRWTISDNGKIIAIPPSPSSVSQAHFKKPRHYSPGNSPIGGDRADIPPLLVKASSSSSSSADSFLSGTPEEKCLQSSSKDSESLESPPRLDRSIITPSLFEDSVNSNSSSGSKKSNNSKHHHRSSSTNSARSKSSRSTSPSHTGGGCGTRGFDFLHQILDVFSLNGGCCHQDVCRPSTTSRCVQ